MERRRYATLSKVPVAKTRSEIEALLERWGCSKVGILLDHENLELEVQFMWRHPDGELYAARFALSLSPIANATKTQREQSQRGKMRALLYFLRSAFDAVEVGIITAETVFLPWLVTGSGKTVSQALLPRMKELSQGNAVSLLEEGR